MADQEIRTVDEVPWGPLGSSVFAKISLATGVALWAFIFQALDGHPEAWDWLVRNKIFVLPLLAWGLVFVVLLFSRGEILDALFVVMLSPLTLFANFLIVTLLGERFRSNGLEFQIDRLTIIMCLAWAALGWVCFRVLIDAYKSPPGAQKLRSLRRAIGLVQMVLVVIAIVLMGAFSLGPGVGHGYSVRSRVSELILAASIAKTAVTEGFQQTQSWSPVWMSVITISATGVVASATIGPKGQIIVYGTEVTSNAVITMVPTVTTDNKLIWSCVGSPAKYMPASCRQ